MLYHLSKKSKRKQELKFSGVGKPFNPNFDGNLLAWYDGDTLNTDPAGTWSDRSANGYDLTLFNNPTIINNAINGHDALQFDGINQYAQRALTPVLIQPNTIYCVFNLLVYVGSDFRIFASNSNDANSLAQVLPNPNLCMYSGAVLNSNPDITVGNYDLMTCVFNTLNSEIRTNNNAAVVGNVGVANADGLQLATSPPITGFSNVEIAYVIVRTGADNTATQNLFINYLKNRFAI